MPKLISVSLFLLVSVHVAAQVENQALEKRNVKTIFKIFKNTNRYKYFSDDAPVTMADGSVKAIAEVKVGEQVKTCKNGRSVVTFVKEVASYDRPGSLLTAVYLRPAFESSVQETPLVPALLLEAAPYHLVQTNKGKKRMKRLAKNDVLYHYEPATGVVSSWKVGLIQENARKVSKAYNLKTVEGTYLVDNLIMAQ